MAEFDQPVFVWQGNPGQHFLWENLDMTKIDIAVCSSIRDVSGQATIDLYMTEFWKDHREVFQTLKQSDANYTEMHDQSIRMSGPGVVNYCWIPDTYFILARSIYYSPSSLSLQVFLIFLSHLCVEKTQN